jgi:hypothetical protein
MNLAAAFTPVASDIPPLFQHQRETVAFHRTHPQGDEPQLARRRENCELA